MFKLITVTLAAMYLIAVTAGEPEQEAQVARAVDPDFDMSLSSFVGAAEASTPENTLKVTDGEAIQIALATGTELRRERDNGVRLLGTGQTLQLAEVAPTPEIDTRDLWQVTGTIVNLRSGPGTGNGVVAKLTEGTEAEVIEEGSGWYRIRTADGAVDGWIFGKYLAKAG